MQGVTQVNASNFGQFHTPHTVNQALATLLQQYQVNPVTKPVLHPDERLPLATHVLVRVGELSGQ